MKNRLSNLFRKASFLGLFLTLLSVQQFYAQKTVTGKVTDETNQGIPGVNIIKQGTSNGVTTDFDGNYSIETNSSDVLVFSFVGYKNKTITVGANTKLNVKLDPDVAALDEIVVIGYGTAKKSDLTGSVSSISAKDLLKAPITKIGSGLQGKISGVNIQQTTGAPGQSMKIRIRGGSSINYSNAPLYVIDGFIGADISTINPSDIASINFLKDASATAIYGSRGANGVVLITTVAPKEGALKVTFDTNLSFSNMINTYDLLPADEMAELMNIQRVSVGRPLAFTDNEIAEFKVLGGTDYQDLVSRQGIKKNTTLNLTGGSENLKYFFSANHLDEEGVIKNSFYKRTSIRSNISGNIGEKIKFKFNTYGTHIDSQANGRGSAGQGNAIGAAVIYPQVWPSKDADGNFLDPNTFEDYNGAFLIGRLVNPEQAILENQETMNDKVISNIDLNVDLGHNLTLNLGASGSFGSGYSGKRTLPNFIDITRENSTATQTTNRSYNYLMNGQLTYEKEFGKHKVKASAVYEFSKGTNRNNSATVGGLSTLANEWYLLQNGAPSSITSGYSEGKLRSYMTRINYSFDNKYLLTASMRADGSSRFNEDNRWGYFPSAALAWKASEEDFIQDINWIDNLKVRVGFGATGNQAIPYNAILSQFDTSADAARYNYYQFNGTETYQGVIPGAVFDPNIQWETTTSYNAGVDLTILDGKISTTIDVYSKKGSDIIIAKSIPRYTGLEAITNNYADIDNNGIEVGINWNIMSTDDLHWTSYFNFSRNKNTVQNLGQSNGEPVDHIFVANEDPIGIWSLVGGNNKFIVQKGESMGSLYGLHALGVWQADEATEAAGYSSYPGEVKYEDIDGDGVISAEDRQIVGQASPEFTFGLGTSVAYKNFDLSVQCVGSIGNDIYNWSNNRLDYNILNPDYRDRWSPTNTGSTQQVMPYGTDYTLTYLVDQYVEDGSYFKVSNLTLGHNFPESVTNALNLSNLRLYASVDNVLTITNYSGLDPESSSTSITSDSQAGIDAFSYPLTRTFALGVKVTF
ncbi:SusC/RagA family TonB-linked outer membrane protein [Lutibacter citreus]|uniref:SusC/RagA family TonB-linked outer membrane protein n=1 Tax=Lutibacter citreus TaxID=2138210 RepID=UPI000DBE5EAA|nr:TonB-dependent receptor [Lutibacter citreus]